MLNFQPSSMFSTRHLSRKLLSKQRGSTDLPPCRLHYALCHSPIYNYHSKKVLNIKTGVDLLRNDLPNITKPPTGVPIAVVCTKVDSMTALEKDLDYSDAHFDLIQWHIRR